MTNEPPYAKRISTDDGNLCNFCEDLLGRLSERSDIPSRPFTSVQEGRDFCKFCDLIYRKVPRMPELIEPQLYLSRMSEIKRELYNRIPETELQRYNSYYFHSLANGLCLLVRHGQSDFTEENEVFPFFLIPSSHVHDGELFFGRLDSAKKPGRAQELMNKWMDDCTRTHGDCANVANENWRPTRLLDIGEGPDFNSLRLCERDEIRPGVTYMTLSYCWGGSQHIKLTNETYDHFRTSIAFTSLPKTFRDALEVVRRFGKRYIWIDSICILQDSDEDWKREADMMCSVYRNSFCNIGATGASDPTQGCFIENIEYTDEVFLISVNRKKDNRTSTSSAGTDFYFFDLNEWDRTLETAPLHKRAWVVQERLLPPRMLHFGLSQVAWECNQLKATERFPSHTSRGTPHSFIAKPLNSSQTEVSLSRSSLDSKGLFRKPWHEIIAAYSEARLTKESDRIPALTGIIDRYKEFTSDDVLAGLWRSTFERDLTWSAVQPGKRHDSYIAPSWSWLSVKDASIRVRPPKLPSTFIRYQVGCVIHAEVTPFPGKSKYTLMNGHIRCWGRVALATSWSSDGPPGDTEGHLLVRSNSNTTKSLGSRFYADTLEAMNATEFLLFPIFLFPIAFDSRILALALAQDEKDPATYRRIGIFEVKGENGLGAACDYLTNMLHSKSNEMGLEPTLHHNVSVLTGDGIIYLNNQHSVKGVSFTVK